MLFCNIFCIIAGIGVIVMTLLSYSYLLEHGVHDDGLYLLIGISGLTAMLSMFKISFLIETKKLKVV